MRRNSLLIPGRRATRMLAVAAVLLLLLPAYLFLRPVQAQLDQDRVARSTVLIAAVVMELENGSPVREHSVWPLGSGVVVSENGHVLTSRHVVTATRDSVVQEANTIGNAEGKELRVEERFLIYTVDGMGDAPDRRFTADLVAEPLDAGLDLAVLRITGNERGHPFGGSISYSHLERGDASTVAQTDVLHLFGYPEFGSEAIDDSFENTSIDDVDAPVRRVAYGAGLGEVNLIYLDATVSTGSSGGAVVDGEGNLVGIATIALGAVGGNVAAAIPINRAESLLRSSPDWPTPTPEPPGTVAPTAAPTLPPTEPPTEPPTHAPTATSAPAPTETPTPEPTEAPALTETSTSEPTVPPTLQPAETPTTQPADTAEAEVDEIVVNGQYFQFDRTVPIDLGTLQQTADADDGTPVYTKVGGVPLGAIYTPGDTEARRYLPEYLDDPQAPCADASVIAGTLEGDGFVFVAAGIEPDIAADELVEVANTSDGRTVYVLSSERPFPEVFVTESSGGLVSYIAIGENGVPVTFPDRMVFAGQEFHLIAGEAPDPSELQQVGCALRFPALAATGEEPGGFRTLYIEVPDTLVEYRAVDASPPVVLPTMPTATMATEPPAGDTDQMAAAAVLEHDAPVTNLAFSPDGSTLVTGDDDGAIRLWDLLDPGTEPGALGEVDTFLEWSLSPDGTVLANGDTDGMVRLWDLIDSGTEPVVLEHGDTIVTTVAFSHDGTVLASGGWDGTVRFWDLTDPGAEPVVLKHEDTIWDLDFSPDGTTLASGSGDGTVRLWDVTNPTSEPVFVREASIFSVSAVNFSPDGTTLAVGDDYAVEIWDLTAPGTEPVVLEHEDEIWVLAFNSDGTMLAAGIGSSLLDTGTVMLWDLTRPEAGPVVLPGHQDVVYAVAFSPDGTTLASASGDGTVRLWDLTAFAPASSTTLPESTAPPAAEESSDSSGNVLLSHDLDFLAEPPMTVRLLRLTIAPGASVPMHVHPGVEFDLVEAGTLTARIDGNAIVHVGGEEAEATGIQELSAGSWIMFTQGTGMSLSNQGTEDVVLLSAVILSVGGEIDSTITYTEGEPAYEDFEGISFVVLGDGLMQQLPEGVVTVTIDELELAAGEPVPPFAGAALVSKSSGDMAFVLESGFVQVTRSDSPRLQPNAAPGQEFTLEDNDGAFFPYGCQSIARENASGDLSLVRLLISPEQPFATEPAVVETVMVQDSPKSPP